MSNINLLPWREARNQRQKKLFGVLLAGCLVATVLLGLAANWLVMEIVDSQKARNQRLQTEIALQDVQLGEVAKLKARRQALLARMQLIADLQERRNLPVRFFNALPDIVPNGVYLSSLQLQGATVDVTGKTEAYGRVASMMRSIDGSGWLGLSRISTIFSAEQTPIALSQFALMFQVLGKHSPDKGEKKS